MGLDEGVVALKTSAALMALVAIGFGGPAPFVARHLLRTGKLPTFMGLFPMYGGGFLERWSHGGFALMLGAFTALSTVEVLASYLLWNGAPLGAYITLGLIPVEIFFWAGFALPIPPVFALVRVTLLLVGWSSLR